MSEQLSWGSDRLGLRFEWDAGSPVRIVRVRRGADGFPVHPLPLVEITTADHGSRPAADRLVHTELGMLLRYVSHAESRNEHGRTLTIRQAAEGIEARITLELLDLADAAVRSRVEVRATSTIVLRSVASWSMGFTSPGADDSLAGWQRVQGTSDWFGEGRWTRNTLRGIDFPQLSTELAGGAHDPRGHLSITSDGTWSTGRHLPVAGLEHQGLAFAWQIEHNGAWRWELGEDLRGGYFSLSGPTDADAAWTKVLRPGEAFTTVPVTVTAGADFTDAVAALTDFRRAARRAHPDNAAMPVVFNDYMNTLMGDPTTEKLLPLIKAAAEVGAEIFCIDAGWYDDSGDWWPSVGEWQPSTTRFPGGLGEVIDAIRDAGMVPGLWLEPEVIGVRSPMADKLPREAFLQRHGQRLVEHHRYHLDLRHPAAVAHLDARRRPPRRRLRRRASSSSTTTSTPGPAPTSTPTASATASSATTAPTSRGSTACSTATPASWSRTAPPARCAWTSPSSPASPCSPPRTSRSSPSTRRSPPPRRSRSCPSRPRAGPTRSPA